MRGTENVFLDLADDTPQIRRLIEMIHEFHLEDVRQWARSNVDAVFIMDDWGTNASLLIDPAMWRAVFRPLYKEYCDTIHDAGKFVFMHSDGHTAAIIGDLVEIGVDALNTQLFCGLLNYGIGLFGIYRGRKLFSPVDCVFTRLQLFIKKGRPFFFFAIEKNFGVRRRSNFKKCIGYRRIEIR